MFIVMCFNLMDNIVNNEFLRSAVMKNPNCATVFGPFDREDAKYKKQVEDRGCPHQHFIIHMERG